MYKMQNGGMNSIRIFGKNEEDWLRFQNYIHSQLVQHTKVDIYTHKL